MTGLSIRIVNRSAHPLPAYATEGSSGMDVRADLSAPIELAPLQRMLMPTGLYLEIPEGYEVQVRPRSGLAANHGLTCLNTPGTIDSDYRGEVKVILINLSDRPVAIRPGDRIAQLVVQRVERAVWVPVEDVSASDRAGGGFGHTGTR
jgi:dUTP pyrophosphatase